MGELQPSDWVDYSRPISFDLNKAKLGKTLDVGNNGTSASADHLGRILQLSTYQDGHGIINAAPYSQFDKARYHDPQYVRQYRQKMLQMLAEDQGGFGLTLKGLESCTVEIQHDDMCSARTALRTVNGIAITCRLNVDDSGCLTQHLVVENTTDAQRSLDYRLDLRLSVHRASYGQLTEGGPLLPPDCENRLRIEHCSKSFSVVNPNLGSQLRGGFTLNGKPMAVTGIQDATRQGVLDNAVADWQQLSIAPRTTVHLAAWFRLGPESAAFRHSTPESSIAGLLEPPKYWKTRGSCSAYIVRRNVDYILGNCTIPINDQVVGLITDHVALPLGWNRDNYWQWRLLLTVHQNADRLFETSGISHYRTRIGHTLQGHLRWVFETAQRPHRFWHRSYVITGRPKDGPTFQLDQQCYPLLELCDYYEAFPEGQQRDFVADIARGSALREVSELVLSKRHEPTGLFPTDETPGDDAVDHPFHFSSHVLLWYTLSRLASLFEGVGAPGDDNLSPRKLRRLAEEIRSAALKHFLQVDDADQKLKLAYLVDGNGERTFYHDANDIPTVFATRWNFLSSDDQLAAWTNTMRFALSERNRLGYADGGGFAGLGSVHSAGAWPLGYFQEMLYAHMSGDASLMGEAVRRVRGSMQWDGTFGEAVDVRTGAVTSKAWFSWPGAMLAAMIIEEGIQF